MKMKKFLALSTASVMALSMAACGSTDNGGAAESSVASTCRGYQPELRRAYFG